MAATQSGIKYKMATAGNGITYRMPTQEVESSTKWLLHRIAAAAYVQSHGEDPCSVMVVAAKTTFNRVIVPLKLTVSHVLDIKCSCS